MADASRKVSLGVAGLGVGEECRPLSVHRSESPLKPKAAPCVAHEIKRDRVPCLYTCGSPSFPRTVSPDTEVAKR